MEKTLIGKYCEEYIKKTLKQHRKRPVILAASAILLLTNATLHGRHSVMALLEPYEWETLDHPPVISSCDFYLFLKLKEDMRDIHYKDLEELELAWSQGC